MSERSNKSSAHWLFATLLGLFFLSGASGLVYQIIWVRLLSRVFGTTTFAVSALLAAFMAGLGLGAYLGGRYLSRRPSPLLWFGLLEIGIGVYALALNMTLPIAQRFFVSVVSDSSLTHYQESLLKVVLAFAILLVPTVFMGASLPLLVQQTVDRMGYLGLRTGALYALNTFGAAVGCLAAGFYAIPQWGLAGTTLVAASVNGLVGIAACALSLIAAGGATKEEPEMSPESSTDGSAVRWAILAFSVSGFAAIGLEVVWTRLFTLVFKSIT